MASFRSPALGYTIANSVSKETSVLLTIPCLLFVSIKMSGKLQLYHTADKQVCQISIYELFRRSAKKAITLGLFFLSYFKIHLRIREHSMSVNDQTTRFSCQLLLFTQQSAENIKMVIFFIFEHFLLAELFISKIRHPNYIVAVYCCCAGKSCDFQRN